jgi:small subunit ribosomal protein S16
MTRIRLSRKGRHKSPFFHILVVHQRDKRDGKFIEKLGTYDPLKQVKSRSEKITINKDRYNHWLSVGAQPSETVIKLVNLVI